MSFASRARYSGARPRPGGGLRAPRPGPTPRSRGTPRRRRGRRRAPRSRRSRSRRRPAAWASGPWSSRRRRAGRRRRPSAAPRSCPRSLPTRTRSPAASPRAAASSGCSATAGSPARQPLVGRVGERRVQEPVRGRGDQREPVLAGRRPPRRAACSRAAGRGRRRRRAPSRARACPTASGSRTANGTSGCGWPSRTQPSRAQPLDGHARERRVAALDQRAREREVVVVERRLLEPHRAGEPAEDLGVRQALAGRRDRRLVPREVHVPVAVVDVDVLGLHRRRQHDVGVVGRVGRDLLDHDGEEVLARERAPDLAGVGVRGERVGAVHDERAHRRVGVEQDVADPVISSERTGCGRRSSRTSAARSPRK